MLCKGDRVRFLNKDDLKIAIKETGIEENENSSYFRDVLELANKIYTVDSAAVDDVRLTELHVKDKNDIYKFHWRIYESYLELINENFNSNISPIYGDMIY